ncbi:MAG: hypothetical protein JO188_14835, partial [Hyphomicrobiales bacterium]|nr:hypothetical protein [Hyphomicrobiales bacterium]
MTMTVPHEIAMESRVRYTPPGRADVWLSTYIGTNVAQKAADKSAEDPAGAEDGLYPMAYLVEQLPHSVTQA